MVTTPAPSAEWYSIQISCLAQRNWEEADLSLARPVTFSPPVPPAPFALSQPMPWLHPPGTLGASTGLCLPAQTGSTRKLAMGVDNNNQPRETRSSPKCAGRGRAAGGAAAPRDSRSRCPAPPSRPGSAGICHRAAAWVGCVTGATERSKAAFKIEKEVLGSEWKIEVV